MRDLPIACSLIPGELGSRREELLPALAGQVRQRQELADGVRLTFDARSDILAHIARVVDAERQCCRFLRFQLTVDQAGAPVTLDITGPPGAREFLEDLLGPESA